MVGIRHIYDFRKRGICPRFFFIAGIIINMEQSLD